MIITRRKLKHLCVRCGKPAADGYAPLCKCGGMIDVVYDLDQVELHDSDNMLERFFELLPIEDPALLLRTELPRTPCAHARSLGKLLGLPRLYLKDETVLPTGTTKDRMAAVALPYLVQQGVRVFCTASTGNSSTAFAQAIHRFGELRCCIFTAEAWSNRVHYGSSDQVTGFVLRDASFVDAFNAAGVYAQSRGFTAERGFFNPGRREGLKLAFMEAVEQAPHPIDWYVQAVSSGMGVVGTYKGAGEMLALGRTDRLPRLLCVQQTSCAPMARAWAESCEQIQPHHIVERPHGIAEAILRGDPTRAYPYVRRVVLESGGRIVAVSEQEIRDARRMIAEHEGIDACFNSAAAMAGLIQQVRAGQFPCEDTVLVNLTGRDRRPQPPQLKLHGLRANGKGWIPEDPDDVRTASIRSPAQPRDEARSIGDILTAHARSIPDRLAIVAEDGTFTYDGLNLAANRIANLLRERAVDGNNRVGVLCGHGARAISVFLGVLKAGLAYVPLDPHLPTSRLTDIVTDAAPALILCDERLRPVANVLAGAGGVSAINTDYSSRTFDDSEPDLKLSPDAPACILYTSGSTGRPKGVIQTHRNLMHFVRCYCDAVGANGDDRLTMLYSPSFAAANMDIYGSLLRGATLYPRDLKRHGFVGFAEWIDEHRLSILHCVPTVLRHFLRTLPDDRRMPSIAAVDLGGEPVHRTDVELCRRHFREDCRVVNHLAATEASVIARMVIDRNTELDGERVPVGKPPPGVRVEVVDEQGQPCPAGEVGRIVVESRYVSPGYWNQPELNAAAFQDVSGRDGLRRYNTGDLGRINHQGLLEHLGRADARVKIRGHSVELTDVEAGLIRTGLVEQAVVVAHDDPSGEAYLAAFIIPVAGRDSSDTDLRHAVRQLLPDYMCPLRFMRVQSLPLTGTGKVDRRAVASLPLPEVVPAVIEVEPAKEQDLRARLAAIWREMLNVTEVGPHDDFFDLGGSSLQAVDMLCRLEELLGFPFPGGVFIEAPTIEHIASVVASRAFQRAGNILVALQKEGELPPLFCIAPNHLYHYVALAKRLAPDRPVFGLQPPYANGFRQSQLSIPAIATMYLKEIRRVRPHGPYHLMGLCSAGYVALEAARQLRSSGKEVGLVALVDTLFSFDNVHVGRVRRRRRFLRHVALHGRVAMQCGPTGGALYLLRKLTARGKAPVEVVPGRIDPLHGVFRDAWSEVRDLTRTYTPRHYPGRLEHFLSGEWFLNRPHDPRHGWERVADGGVRRHWLPCSHESIFVEPSITHFVRRLRRCLAGA